jgi:hypothetical protein
MSSKKKKAQSRVISGGNNINISGNVAGSNIVTGDNNSISIKNNTQDYLLNRIAEELVAEGEDSASIWNKSEDALSMIIRRIASRLGRSIDEVWEALRRLGTG